MEMKAVGRGQMNVLSTHAAVQTGRNPERFAEGLGAWLTQRGKGEGQPVAVQVTRE